MTWIPRSDTRPPTPDELAEMRRTAKDGADRLASTAAGADRGPKLTNAQSAAIARAKLDRGQR